MHRCGEYISYLIYIYFSELAHLSPVTSCWLYHSLEGGHCFEALEHSQEEPGSPVVVDSSLEQEHSQQELGTQLELLAPDFVVQFAGPLSADVEVLEVQKQCYVAGTS